MKVCEEQGEEITNGQKNRRSLKMWSTITVSNMCCTFMNMQKTKKTKIPELFLELYAFCLENSREESLFKFCTIQKT